MSDNLNESAFNYCLTLNKDGSVDVKNKSGNSVSDRATSEHPPISKILNVRTVTITEAADSPWIFVDPPGNWYPVD